MRCNNCGWENLGGNSKCEKCGTVLSGSIPQGHERVYDESSSREFNPNKTVRENEAFGNVQQNTQESESICPKCGYPIREGDQSCPNCNHSANAESPRQQTRRDFNPSEKKKTGGTIPWWEMAGNAPACTLTILPRENEKINQTELNFNGDEIILTRDNTEPNNQTITSGEQAMLTYENNKWYIQDKSSLKTTYIHAGEKREIQSGDVIVLGSRRFEFKD